MKSIGAVIISLTMICLTSGAKEDTIDSEESVLKHCAFIIISQPDSYHSKIAQEARLRLVKSLAEKSIDASYVYISDQDIHLHGAWTMFPIIANLYNRQVHAKWYIFLDLASHVDLDELEKVIKKHPSKHFVGYALKDRTHSVIHHFKDPKELQYPDFETGFMLSHEAFNDLGFELTNAGTRSELVPKDFSIDAQYELSKALIGLHPEDFAIVHEPQFCLKKADRCAIYPVTHYQNCSASPNTVTDLAMKTLFAVKTCSMFHEERLPVIKETWAKAAPNIIFVSEVEDPKIGTIRLENIKNTERGHCAKTMAILRYFAENADTKGWSWLVIADDDTILSVHKMLEHLHCFDAGKPIHLGQRYGYRVAHGNHGYDYVTGGGGMVFSLELVKEMVTEVHCSCMKPDSPDDMHLGACMSNLGYNIIHSSRFHQARPEDYAEDLLSHQDPISFHKFWETDPLIIYGKWFAESDIHLKEFKYNSQHPHQEL